MEWNRFTGEFRSREGEGEIPPCMEWALVMEAVLGIIGSDRIWLP